MRELSRILLELKKLEPTIHNLFDGLKPEHYDQLVEATKSVANYDTVNDTFDSPTFAMNISTALKQCCDIAIHMVIKNEPSVETASLKTMINLLQSNWRFDVSGRAGNDLNLIKFNKATIVPLATDLRLLKNYLLLKAGEAVNRLARNAADANAYNTLLETVYFRVILLNRKRPGELQRMFLRTYESSEIKSGEYEEFEEVITEVEKLLIKNLKRVVIRVVSEQKGKKTELPVAVNKKKRILTPWPSEQKEAVTFFFNKNIKMKKSPKRKDCEEIKSLYPELLANKDWLKIKVFIQNVYSKKKQISCKI
ncbi:unnamed protein product [Acanthoscelides obtectus]|uniref:Uncharacterized protein n=1 Tax=Acanthoscelides obtectus TaxID=200917 RepID=A0A9P0M8I1_ACAOB|nr:unnamed protein product [Acanthoscelides obtectus]CAK1677012.1 hypothetical protein AOBTE_LOCUS31064 [Acanthoscelides obtectus]